MISTVCGKRLPILTFLSLHNSLFTCFDEVDKLPQNKSVAIIHNCISALKENAQKWFIFLEDTLQWNVMREEKEEEERREENESCNGNEEIQQTNSIHIDEINNSSLSNNIEHDSENNNADCVVKEEDNNILNSKGEFSLSNEDIEICSLKQISTKEEDHLSEKLPILELQSKKEPKIIQNNNNKIFVEKCSQQKVDKLFQFFHSFDLWETEP